MRDPDPKTTLRELREYFTSSHESQRKIAAHIGVSQTTIWAWLAGKQHPAAESVARLRVFFDAEAKRLAQGVCPKCGASGPVRESHREALRAWNGRE
jgi:transcriptional regulator with XRE-family HTH domain